MSTKFSPLPQAALHKGVSILRPSLTSKAGITEDSRAVEAMTDLARVSPVTVETFATIGQANNKMMEFGVRLLLVMDTGQHLAGVITATDVLGERPVKYQQRVNCAYDDILVMDIMTPLEDLEVMHLVDVERAYVGDILASLKRVGRQHALVVDVEDETLSQRVCGIFSTTQISRLMNQRIEIAEVANSFADVEMALTH